MAKNEPVRRWSSRHRLIDRCVAAGVLITDLVAQIVASAGGSVEAPALSPAAALLALASAAPLLWRRRRPFTALCALGTAAVIAAATMPPGLFTQQIGATVVLAIYGVGAWSEHRRWAAVVPAAILALVVAGGIGDGTPVLQAALAGTAVVGLPWATGYAARSRRLYIEEVERRLADAERDRDERTRRAVADERSHIARELHDVVAHHVSLIGVQAGAARTTLAPGADGTRTALAAIEDSSRSAILEMRRLLHVLTSDDSGPQLAPQPGLADLGRLVDGFRAAGIEVATTLQGDDHALDPVLDVCCYRLVEEALTNVARHSSARRATVTVATDTDRVRITVCDPGPALLAPPGPARSGRGLIGMAERVALFDGRLDTGRCRDGGFAVIADLGRRCRP